MIKGSASGLTRIVIREAGRIWWPACMSRRLPPDLCERVREFWRANLPFRGGTLWRRWRQDLESAAIPAKRNSKRRMRQAQKRNVGNTLDATSVTSAETSNLANAPTASLMAVMLQSKSETPEPSQLRILNFGSVAKKGP